MTIKEILSQEKENKGTITLLREGLFWRAYEHSAYLFHHHIHPYKPIRKWVVAVKQDVVSLGFPVKSAEKVLDGCRVLLRTENTLLLESVKEDSDNLRKWKDTLPVETAAHTKVAAPESAAPAGNTVYPVKGATSFLYEEIMNYPVESHTPVECMLFVMELKRKLKEGGACGCL